VQYSLLMGPEPILLTGNCFGWSKLVLCFQILGSDCTYLHH
jgi:hypothetical protein